MSDKEIAALNIPIAPRKPKSLSERYAAKLEQEEEQKQQEEVAEIENS